MSQSVVVLTQNVSIYVEVLHGVHVPQVTVQGSDTLDLLVHDQEIVSSLDELLLQMLVSLFVDFGGQIANELLQVAHWQPNFWQQVVEERPAVLLDVLLQVSELLEHLLWVLREASTELLGHLGEIDQVLSQALVRSQELSVELDMSDVGTSVLHLLDGESDISVGVEVDDALRKFLHGFVTSFDLVAIVFAVWTSSEAASSAPLLSDGPSWPSLIETV